MINDEIPELPEIKERDLHLCDLDFAVKELEKAQNIFLFYENERGELRLLFDKLSAPLYACMVVKLAQAKQQKVYEFLKLVLEAVYQIKRSSKRGFDKVCKIASILNKIKQ